MESVEFHSRGRRAHKRCFSALGFLCLGFLLEEADLSMKKSASTSRVELLADHVP